MTIEPCHIHEFSVNFFLCLYIIFLRRHLQTIFGKINVIVTFGEGVKIALYIIHMFNTIPTHSLTLRGGGRGVKC